MWLLNRWRQWRTPCAGDVDCSTVSVKEKDAGAMNEKIATVVNKEKGRQKKEARAVRSKGMLNSQLVISNQRQKRRKPERRGKLGAERKRQQAKASAEEFEKAINALIKKRSRELAPPPPRQEATEPDTQEVPACCARSIRRWLRPWSLKYPPPMRYHCVSVTKSAWSRNGGISSDIDDLMFMVLQTQGHSLVLRFLYGSAPASDVIAAAIAASVNARWLRNVLQFVRTSASDKRFGVCIRHNVHHVFVPEEFRWPEEEVVSTCVALRRQCAADPQ